MGYLRWSSYKVPRKALVDYVEHSELAGARGRADVKGPGRMVSRGGSVRDGQGVRGRGRASVWPSSVCDQVSDTDKPRLNTEARLLLVVVCSVFNCEPVSFHHDPSQDVK